MSSDDSTMRLFFAIAPGDAARARLDALARDIARATGGRATAPDTLHLTVVFVGTVATSAVESIREAGDAVAFAPFELRLDRIGAFARAGVAWAAPSLVPAALASANRDLVRELSARGVDTERRPFRPHVTLARRCVRALEAPIEPPIDWRVDRIVLMSSRTLSEGPRYREFAVWNL